MTDSKTATERLRELLDERGVEWKEYGYENHAWWEGADGIGWHAENRPSLNGLYVKIEAVLTPEQAIAATLGNGECEIKELDSLMQTISMANGCAWGECSVCGGLTPDDSQYCMNCGEAVKR